jgi:branched-chain amino acid transport system substrate-binding protein
MNRRSFACKVALAVALLAGTAFGAGAETLKVGLIGPMTGPGAPWGFAAKVAMEMQADKVNAKGGLDVGGTKYQVKVITYDDMYKASEAVAAYNRLTVQDGVKIVVIQTSAPTMALKQNLEDDKIVGFTTSYTPAAIDDKTRFLFRAYSTATDFMPSYAAWMAKNIKEKKMATLNPNDETGWSQQNTTVAPYKSVGFTVVDSELYERSMKDFAPLMTKVMATGPEVIDLGSSSPATAGMIVRQARDAGYKGRFVQTGGAAWVEAVQSAGKEGAEGMINILYADPDNAAFQEVVAEYKKRVNGQQPNEIVAVYTDMMSVILASVQKAGTISDATRIAAAIPAALPMKSLQGDEMTYAPQQIRTWDYIGVLTDGHPKVIGKVQ